MTIILIKVLHPPIWRGKVTVSYFIDNELKKRTGNYTLVIDGRKMIVRFIDIQPITDKEICMVFGNRSLECKEKDIEFRDLIMSFENGNADIKFQSSCYYGRSNAQVEFSIPNRKFSEFAGKIGDFSLGFLNITSDN